MLGEILVECKVITEDDLNDALIGQKTSNKRLGKIFIVNGKASSPDIFSLVGRELDVNVNVLNVVSLVRQLIVNTWY